MTKMEMLKDFLTELIRPIVMEAVNDALLNVERVPTKRYYTRAEAMEHLKIGTTSFYRLAKKGKITILKIEGKTLVDADELDGAIERQEIVKYKRY